MLTSFLRTIGIFFTISFSMTILSMNCPITKKKLSRSHGQQLEKKGTNPLALPILSTDSLGCYFSTFSSDILNRFLVYDLDSRGKENFRRTNKLLNELLDLEKTQAFIFQNSLNASKKDISGLIIRTLNMYKQNRNEGDKRDIIPSFKLNFIKEISSRFIQESDVSKNILVQYSSEIIGLSETLKWNLICADDKYSNDFSINGIKIPSRSLIVACVTRDYIMLRQCLESISEDSFSKNLRRALHIVTQNNDISSLRLIMNKIKKITDVNRISSELVQLGLLCASDDVMGLLMILYKRTKSIYQFDHLQPLREENFFANWIDTPIEVKDKTLYAIAAQYYFLLSEIHKNNPSKFHTCLKIIFEDNEFLQYLPHNSVHNRTKKPILRRIISCSTM